MLPWVHSILSEWVHGWVRTLDLSESVPSSYLLLCERSEEWVWLGMPYKKGGGCCQPHVSSINTSGCWKSLSVAASSRAAAFPALSTTASTTTSAPTAASAALALSTLSWHKLVLYSRDVVSVVWCADLLRGLLDLPPLIHNELNSACLSHDLGETVADCDDPTLLDVV